MTIGDRIFGLRKAAGMSQVDMEKASGIKREYLSKLENNQLPNPTIRTLERIAIVLKVPLVVFFGHEADLVRFFAIDSQIAELEKQRKSLGVLLDNFSQFVDNLRGQL